MDSGCNRHVTSHLEDYVSYQRFSRPGSAEIANKTELPILGMGIVIIKHICTDGKQINIRLDNVLYVPNASGRFYSTGAATQKGCEARETQLTNKIYSSDGTLLIEGTHKQATGLCYFNARILQGDETNVPVKLSTINISQSDLWHQRLAHANYEVIRALPTETTGGPDQKLQLPSKVCDGCEKGKSKRLPFPPSTSRAKHVLDLVHSDLDEMSSASIDGYNYTATYLDNHSRYGMMFFLKNKSEQFGAFKTYKAWAERHTDRQLKCIRTDRGGEFLSNEQKGFMEESGIEHQTSMPDSPQQNGRAERFQQTILNKAESMRHMAGLSSGFWSYAVRTAIHVYNVTPIAKDGFKTPKRMWSGLTPDISHLRIFGCSAYVTINKKKRRKLDPKSREMTFIGYEPGSKGYQFWDKDS